MLARSTAFQPYALPSLLLALLRILCSRLAFVLPGPRSAPNCDCNVLTTSFRTPSLDHSPDDAVATVGLAACAVTKDSFSTYKASNTACASDNSWVEAFDNNNTKCTGPALHAKIATLEFAGMSGTVKFGSTATRDTTTATYKMFQFETQNGAQAPVEDEVAAWSGSTLWTFSKTCKLRTRFETAVSISSLADTSFIDSFPGGRGSIQPPSTVIPKHEQNLIGTTLPILGYSMMGINWLCALVFLIWVGMESKHDVIKKSQPVFLAFICIGCIVS